MKIRASLLAAVAVAYVLGLSAGAGLAQDAQGPDKQGPDKQAPAAAPAAMPSAGALRDARPVIETSKPETGAGQQPSIKPVPGDGARDAIWNSPIDASIAVHQGRKPNKDSRSALLPGRALLGHLLNKSKSGITPGVAVHHDAPRLQQKLPAGGQGEPARNAIGAHIEHRAMVHRDAASPVGKSAGQSVVPQGAGTASPGVQGAASASAPGTVTATIQNRGTPPVDRPAALAHGLVTLSAGGPAINGTAMIRPGAGTGAIGGSVRTVAGVISGSNVRMRHP
jgi:hypothetical protein